MLSSITQSRWFDFADLLLAFICALAWAFFGSWGLAILIVSLLPWGVRLMAGRFPFRRTAFDIPIWLFLLTAGVSVWSAYDPSAAWEKFWWIVAAGRLYYALAAQPRENLALAATTISAGMALLCLLFLFAFDWVNHPLLGPINWLGAKWMALRPNLPLPMPEPDLIGGLAAVTLPLVAVIAFAAYRRKNYPHLTVSIVIGLILGLGLLMSAERPAWAGLFLAACLWVGWQACTWLARRTGYRIEAVAGIGIIAVILAGLLPGIVIWQHYGQNPALWGRLSIAFNGAQLAASYPLIGGGLGATPGLYSRYMMGIPYLFLPNVWNHYVDVAIEQGILGLVAIIWIFAGALLLCLRSKPLDQDAQANALKHYRWAVGLGIVILAGHGMMEDALYCNWGLTMMLLLPGFAVSLDEPVAKHPVSLKGWATAAGVAAVLLAIGFRPLVALWHANLGAVFLSRVQLAGWPDDYIYGERLLAQTGPAEREFEQALTWQSQATAHYDLGLIAIERRDFESASAHLKTAFEQWPTHPGIRKALGYSYAWMGDIEAAGKTLRPVAEAAYELSIYAQWWVSEGREDLSNYALQTAEWLKKK